MHLVEARRLTGRNLQCEGPAALAEVSFADGEDRERLIELWQCCIGQLAEQVDFVLGPTHIRRFPGGAALSCVAPIDALYAAVCAVEWAVGAANKRVEAAGVSSLSGILAKIEAERADERSVAMVALQEQALARGVPFLWDDDEVSIGYGRYGRTYARANLPEVGAVPWTDLREIPVALITGTNGKTTTARMTARIMRHSGLTVGNSATDGIYLNEQSLNSGDWTGPGAARAILRHPEVEVAVLETARGGILRRGLGVECCDVAVVTNVAADHLGEYGIFDVPDMARAKGLVYDAVRSGGVEVVNVDDEHLKRATRTDRSFLTGMDYTPAMEAHVSQGGAAAWFEQGGMRLAHSGHRFDVIGIEQMPIARGGGARYNMANALNAVAVSFALGASIEAIRAGLSEFGAHWNDNPGRGQLTEVGGVRVLLDFGHNPHGVQAVLEMARTMRVDGGRVSISFAQAGDRTEADLKALLDAIVGFEPDRLYLRDLPEDYWRGRTPEESHSLFCRLMDEGGGDPSRIIRVPSEAEALERGLEWAQPSDLVIHLVHLEREAVHDRLRTLGAPI